MIIWDVAYSSIESPHCTVRSTGKQWNEHVFLCIYIFATHVIYIYTYKHTYIFPHFYIYNDLCDEKDCTELYYETSWAVDARKFDTLQRGNLKPLVPPIQCAQNFETQTKLMVLLFYRLPSWYPKCIMVNRSQTKRKWNNIFLTIRQD